jgi:hypothetical protein
MAPFLLLGGQSAIFLVVPLFGALLVGSAYVVGSRFAPRVGLASALLIALSPAFLFQLMQPMSDVPAAALWLLAVAFATGPSCRAPVRAGLATSAAILVRPNLLPLGLVIGAFCLAGGLAGNRRRDAVRYAAASAPGCIVVGIVQQMFYGSPLRSGYGSLDALFAASHIAPNAARYFTWLWQTHTPVVLIALTAPLFASGSLTWLLLSLVAVNVAGYLPYVVFNDWWYLRFLLPAIAMLLILAVAAVDGLVRVVLQRQRRAVSPLLPSFAIGTFAILLSVFFVQEARARSVFGLKRLESRYVSAGRYVSDRLPSNALLITSWESGSVRFYSGRKTLVWDALDPAWLDRAISYSRTRGFEPYLLFEKWEEPLFRQRFPQSAVGALDWPPAAEVAGQVTVYKPGDREQYFAGRGAPTEYAK